MIFSRQGLSGVTLQANVAPSPAWRGVPILAVTSTGGRFAIALSGPLTNDYPDCGRPLGTRGAIE